MRDRAGEVVYVGTAADLQNRLRSYFQEGTSDTRFFVPLLAGTLGDIETILTQSAKEALILEGHLIKTHQPRYNVRLKDDKSFLHLRLDPAREWPRIDVVRRRAKDGAHYFGPYHSARSIRETLRLVNRHFQLRSCTDSVLRNRRRPCLQHQIGRCPAPCVLPVDRAEYARNIEDVRLFLGGQGRVLVDRLRRDMKAAAEALEFERAARIRDQLAAVERSLQRQSVDLARGDDVDAFALHREGAEVTVQVVRVRQGLLTSSRAWHLSDRPMPSEELLRDFVGRYYGDDAEVDLPDVVLVPLPLEDAAARAEWLTERRGRRVEVRTPQRGALARLVDLAQKNAAQAFEERQRSADDREKVLAALQRKLELPSPPRRMECYDISQLQGGEATGARVVFQDGEPHKDQYRRYAIRGVIGQDDFAMMKEVLSRRFRPAKGAPDDAPDLLVVDGGIGQLNIARAVLAELGIADIPLASLAKSRVIDGGPKDRSEAPEHSPERVFLPGRKNPVVLRQNSNELYLLQRLRDEAHRFAITYHRERRRKRTLTTALDEIPGVGPTRRRLLLTHFGSLKRLRDADLAAIQAVPGLPPRVAERVYEHLRGE
jgi:excinuclease ABC subunit C